ncbi:DUF3888 domain-containing protein [Bacillus cytotoxicus]|uniref:DUF3888 domain-containing protein n=1 Tax=Bacillus cereus group sp. BfR-BA-01492 TaxID=2920361 RepID=UPI001F58DF47|nr:DUF3888 domain-containing protein [Bacillus cereus group sp. BfR-BA-01492]
MKKIMYFVLCSICIVCSVPGSAAAQYNVPLLEDALYSVLFPQINAAMEKHYGKLKPYDCPKIVSLKKLYSGTYVFQAVIEVTKYEPGTGGEKVPPFEKVNVTFNNEEGEWNVTKVEVKRLPNHTKINCKK